MKTTRKRFERSPGLLARADMVVRASIAGLVDGFVEDSEKDGLLGLWLALGHHVDAPSLAFFKRKKTFSETCERQRRAGEGYVEDVTTPAPSVISMNTTLAGLAVSTFLQLLTDFMGEQGSVSRLNYDVLSGTVSRGGSRRANPCVCGKFRGFERLRPLPLWTLCDPRGEVAVTTFRVSPSPNKAERGGRRRLIPPYSALLTRTAGRQVP